MPFNLTGPHFAWSPHNTRDRGRIWLQSYWSFGPHDYANRDEAVRRASIGAAVLAAEEQRWQHEVQAKFDALPDDVIREQLKTLHERKIERINAERGGHLARELLDRLAAEEDRRAAAIVGEEGVRRSYIEAVVEAVEAEDMAKFWKVLDALPDDSARRGALIKRLEAEGRLSASQIDDVVDAYESRNWGRAA
jgi:hypothetical protein